MAHHPEQIRNVVVIGAGGAGKTTLVEALLHKANVTTRRGTIQEKNTVTDWDDDEKEREQSLLATPVNLEWNGHNLRFIDTPGRSTLPVKRLVPWQLPRPRCSWLMLMTV